MKAPAHLPIWDTGGGCGRLRKPAPLRRSGHVVVIPHTQLSTTADSDNDSDQAFSGEVRPIAGQQQDQRPRWAEKPEHR